MVRFTPVTEEDHLLPSLLFAYFQLTGRRYGVAANNMKQVVKTCTSSLWAPRIKSHTSVAQWTW